MKESTPRVMDRGVLDSRELGGYLLNHVVVDMDDSSLSLIRCGTLRPLADDFDEALSHPFTEQQTEDDSSEQPCGRQAQFNALNSPHIWVTRVSPGKPVSALSRVPAALTLAGVQWREG